MEENLLSAQLVLYPKKTLAIVKLDKKEIRVKSTSNGNGLDEVVSLGDVIGCHIFDRNEKSGAKWYIRIFAYPLKKKIFKGLARQRIVRSYGFACCRNNAENKALAEKWRRVIKHLISGETLTKDDIDRVTEKQQRRCIVYINPFSGRGNGEKIYNNQVKPVFDEAEINQTAIITEYAGHAKLLAKQLELDKYDGIIIVAGDGLVYEIINGLMEREDWARAIKTPIGVVATGSGNALAASTIYASTELHPIPSVLLSSIFEICRGKVVDLDLMSLELADPDEEGRTKTLYGSLGIIMGLIADVDIESERLRFLGGAMRSDIYAVMRIVTLRKYNITVSYLPLDEEEPSKDFPAEQCPGQSGDSIKANKKMDNNLVPLSDDLPPIWRTITDNFIQISSLSLSHIGEEYSFHSSRKSTCDGKITLVMLKSSASRMKIVKLWGMIEDGQGIQESSFPGDVKVVQCKAFRIVPHSKHSEIITLDGELLPFGPFQCQIHHRLARVYSSKT